ncbi:hypothetical protein BaRGS_00030393 [Batillaria attramentaria]|uniref:2'-5'-oligoadenylate synthetase 1 domain-containing protein n=1 Tax=Batillaria attramentaria TaxID=370345 RepID=A0ABD0JUN6_9CAEN
MAEDVLSRLSGKQLTRFLEDELKPKGDDIDSMNKEVDQFVRFLHQCSDPPFTVDRVVKGGSLGKGTAVRGSSDIDLEVVFNGLSSIEELKNNREVLLDRIERAAEKYKWRGGIQQTKRTKFSIQFKLNGKDVDVLPVFDAMKRKEGFQFQLHVDAVRLYLESTGDIYRQMDRYREGAEIAAKEYSASLSELQIAEVKGVDARVKDVIRLLKFWKKHSDSEATRQIPSYSMELLALHMSRRYMSLGIEDLFRKCMGKLGCCHDIRVAFDANYDSRRYTGRADPPYILDPANPLMNTLSGLDHKEVTRAAQRYFQDFYNQHPQLESPSKKRRLRAAQRQLALSYH